MLPVFSLSLRFSTRLTSPLSSFLGHGGGGGFSLILDPRGG
ncbi:MAG: hypothetical protein ACI974_001430 [Paraglaciecola sp.]|jgi:hypothetical protein